MPRFTLSADPAPQVILAYHGRELALALAPAAPPSALSAHPWLPDDAKLSSGLRNTSGGWMVRNEDVGNLSLTFRSRNSSLR